MSWVAGIDWTTVIVALLSALAAGVPATVVAWRTHQAVNSRMDRMLELAEQVRRTAATEAASVGGRRVGDKL